ncbi:endonuclease/exonuclease/phosphatase family protein [Polaribacter sargassicola]|uniref:endonuclease/exonuclease/phosphatase family protein n=1 Tax=Polaribacter sargassicola TaxID=2836891 RepID=UPI001F34F8F5|nr:endonuclease/exonuclease/phosphatase family protein [Polaribacter sp. DS7-9]MCG1036917.1 endonuclease/exonuclease/phosphatase family protein [Polaribacter sp. DS7-9]
MKNLSFFDKIIYVINSLFATLLLFSYFLRYISPEAVPVFVVLSVFIPILIIINIIFVAYWVIRLKKQFLLSSSILAIGLLFSTPFFKFSGKNISTKGELKIMSYNVKSFDLFKQFDENAVKNGFDFIKEVDPDILVLQEFYEKKRTKEPDISFPHKYLKMISKNKTYGMAIYSKYKIINSGSLDFENTFNNIIFTDILKGKDTIRIYNIHLESLGITQDIEHFDEKKSNKLLRAATNSFKKQANQTKKFVEHDKTWKGKKIVCGDFNNTSFSWVYNQISKDKKDAFVEAGQGFGKSYNYPFPMRIDFILADKTASVNQFETFKDKYSDHFPITATLNWEE